jgi:hypothetical protein
MPFNPSSIQIRRQLGATRPLRPPTLPRPNANPRLGSSLNLHEMMRPQNRAEGGIVDSPEQPFTGGIMSTGAGRADDVPMHVPDGAYVMPAWAVSHLGEGNTINGMSMLKGMFGSPWGAGKAPFGAPQPSGKLPGKGIKIPKPPPMHFQPPNFYPQGMSAENPALAAQKHGGAAHGAAPVVPINASGGEFVIEPDEVAKIGDGNVNKGHLILDKWLLTLKREAATTIAKLPGPAK